MATHAPPLQRRSISAVVRSADASAPARRDGRSARLSLNEKASATLSAYYTFSSRRRGSLAGEDQPGLSGFLEYRKLDGSWRPFLFQTVGYQLVVFRVHVTHQVQVMSTDIRDASEIALDEDGGDLSTTRLFRLGINGTVITLRAVSHHVAMYWLDGLRELRNGRLPDIAYDRATLESEDDIFRQIDHMTQLREWRPPPSTASASLCGLCFPCLGRLCAEPADAPSNGVAAFATTHSPRPIAR